MANLQNDYDDTSDEELDNHGDLSDTMIIQQIKNNPLPRYCIIVTYEICKAINNLYTKKQTLSSALINAFLNWICKNSKKSYLINHDCPIKHKYTRNACNNCNVLNISKQYINNTILTVLHEESALSIHKKYKKIILETMRQVTVNNAKDSYLPLMYIKKFKDKFTFIDYDKYLAKSLLETLLEKYETNGAKRPLLRKNNSDDSDDKDDETTDKSININEYVNIDEYKKYKNKYNLISIFDIIELVKKRELTKERLFTVKVNTEKNAIKLFKKYTANKGEPLSRDEIIKLYIHNSDVVDFKVIYKIFTCNYPNIYKEICINIKMLSKNDSIFIAQLANYSEDCLTMMFNHKSLDDDIKNQLIKNALIINNNYSDEFLVKAFLSCHPCYTFEQDLIIKKLHNYNNDILSKIICKQNMSDALEEYINKITPNINTVNILILHMKCTNCKNKSDNLFHKQIIRLLDHKIIFNEQSLINLIKNIHIANINDCEIYKLILEHGVKINKEIFEIALQNYKTINNINKFIKMDDEIYKLVHTYNQCHLYKFDIDKSIIEHRSKYYITSKSIDITDENNSYTNLFSAYIDIYIIEDLFRNFTNIPIELVIDILKNNNITIDCYLYSHYQKATIQNLLLNKLKENHKFKKLYKKIDTLAGK